MIELTNVESRSDASPRRSLLRQPGLWLVTGLLVGVVATMAVVAQRHTASPTPTKAGAASATAPASATPTGSGASASAQELLKLVGEANTPDANTITSGGPTVLAAPGVQAGLLDQWREQEDVTKPAASYQMLIYCAGHGQVDVTQQIGAGHSSTHVVCRDQAPQAGSLFLHTGGSPTIVTITADGGPVAVAYHLNRG